MTTGRGSIKEFTGEYKIFITVFLSIILLTFIGLITKFNLDDLLSEGVFFVIGITGLFIITEMKNRMLTLGWSLFVSGIFIDVTDELIELPVWLDDYYEHASTGLGLLIVVVGFYLLVKQKSKTADSLKEITNLDHLTGLNNHRSFYDDFEQLVSGKHAKITLLFCDLDYFKTINDAHGHIAGDMVLKTAADLIQDHLKDKDSAYRYGGEEFVILLKDCHVEQAFSIAEDIRRCISDSAVLQQYATFFPVTVSIGLASYPHDSADARDLIDKADMAMYFAKQKGRNQCIIYNPDIEDILGRNYLQSIRQEMLINSVFSIASAIDAKDRYTGRHSELVTKYVLQMAEAIEMSEHDKFRLRIGALMHDCGKIGIPDDIINKPGNLSVEEFTLIKNHTLLGYNIIKHITDDTEIASCVLYHHERWDGKGYPHGLAGGEIPLFARIICIADAYDAMTSGRSYRGPLNHLQALEELERNAGAQFDPQLVTCFIGLCKDSGHSFEVLNEVAAAL